jgi:tetratricopeptide (TPR) repeat protein
MLALSLTTVGLVFDRITHYERAAGIYERKKIDIFRQDRLTLRAGLDEGNLESALSSMANDLMLLSGGEERLGCNEEAALILRELDALEPTKYTEELAGTLLNLANNLRDLGRLSAARETIGEAISALHSVPEPGSNTLYKMAMMLIADADICAKDDQCSPDVGIASAQEALDILSFISGNLEDAFAEERKAATLALSELSKRKPA